MRVPLPSGAWVDLADTVTTAVHRAVQAAVDVEIVSDGSGSSVAKLPGDHLQRREDALLLHMITGWSWAEQGIPIPSQNAAGVDTILATITNVDDSNALSDAIQPLMEKANPTRRPNSRRPSAN
jgi:hypothetical protein